LPADVPSFIEAISGDPWDVSDHQHLVVTFHSPCSAPYTPVCFAETTDGGGSWRVLSFALQDNWGEGALITMLDATHWIYTNNGTYYTSDEGAHWAPIPNSPLAPGVGSSGPVFKTPDGRYYLGSGYGVMSSTDGQNWSLLPSSGYLIDSVIGDGQHLFAIEGFHAPRNDDTGNFFWTASYASPTLWSNGPVSGLPSSLNSGSNSMAYDADHHLLYTTLGAEGVWRLRTY
jgi:hypothetical protein